MNVLVQKVQCQSTVITLGFVESPTQSQWDAQSRTGLHKHTVQTSTT